MLRLHKPHINPRNLYNQVAVVAVNLLGDELDIDEQSDDILPGRCSGGQDDISFDMTYDPSTAKKLRELASAKERAVETEDYGLAKRIKHVQAAVE